MITFLRDNGPRFTACETLGLCALAVSASVAATAIGPSLTGYLIDQGTPLPAQMIYLSGWCLAARIILGFTVPYIFGRNAIASHD